MLLLLCNLTLNANCVNLVGIFGCCGERKYACEQQWPDYQIRCCGGIEDENIFKVCPPICMSIS